MFPKISAEQFELFVLVQFAIKCVKKSKKLKLQTTFDSGVRQLHGNDDWAVLVFFCSQADMIRSTNFRWQKNKFT